MCRSIADGGRRCAVHNLPRRAAHARAVYAAAANGPVRRYSRKAAAPETIAVPGLPGVWIPRAAVVGGKISMSALLALDRAAYGQVNAAIARQRP